MQGSHLTQAKQVHKLASPLYKGSKERDNSQGSAAVHELASPLYKGSNREEHNDNI